MAYYLFLVDLHSHPRSHLTLQTHLIVVSSRLYFYPLHDNILGDLRKCLLKLQISNVECLFLMYSSRSWNKKERKENKQSLFQCDLVSALLFSLCEVLET